MLKITSSCIVFSGAVKFNNILPWEQDADIVFLTANFSAFENQKKKFTDAGYSFAVTGKDFVKRFGRLHRGKFDIGTTHWRVEVWGYGLTESEMLAVSGQLPTKVHFAGQWVTVMRNPGLFARNRYGPGIYKHKEHWLTLGHGSSHTFYSDPGKFSPCPKPGHTGCLDQYPGDGSMQFRTDYCPY